MLLVHSYTTSSLVLGVANEFNISSNSSVNTDILGYFNPTTGIYTFGDTPNHTIHYTASINVTKGNPGGNQACKLFLRYNSIFTNTPEGDIIAQNQSLISSAPFTVTVQGTASYVENDYIYTEIQNLQGPTTNVSNIRWSFTQSLNPNTDPSTLTVLEPYLLSNFKNTDCDVTMNNVSEQEVSGFYRRVNYNSGATIPTNQQQIISQTAEFADVKDYNYSARAHILPRYNGVRTVQKNENVYTEGEYVY
jgi:hypothetical protein